MTVIRAGLLAALLMFGAGAAAAQAPTGRERADAIIAAADAADLFSNVTEKDDQPTVRHNATGVTCAFRNDGTGAVKIITQFAARGDDVACELPFGDVSATVYATRRPGVSVKDELKIAEMAIKMRWQKVRTYKPKGVLKKMLPGFKPPEGIDNGWRWFTVSDGDDPLVTGLAVARAGDWIVKMRVTGPAPDLGGRTELLAESLWLTVLMDIAAAPAPAS